MTHQHNYPILSIEDALGFFHEVIPELNLTENDFKAPTFDRMHRFYSAVLEYVGDVHVDHLHQHQLKAAKHLKHPELHESSVSMMTFTLVLQRFMFACGVSDFKLRDLLDPKPKRSVRMASAIINFDRFKSERMHVIDKLNAENASLKDQCSQFYKLNDEIKCKINNIKASRAEQEPEIKELEEKMMELKNKIESHHSTQSGLQKTSTEIKANIAERKAAVAHLESNIKTAREQGEGLSRQIVQSPDRLKGEMERMRNQVIQLKASRDEKMRRLMELRDQKEKRKQLDNECEQGLKLISAMHVEIERDREVLDEVSNLSDQITTNKDELRSLSTQEQQLKRMVSTKVDKLSKLTLQHQHKMTNLQETVEQLRKEHEHLQHVQSADLEQKQAIENRKRLIIDQYNAKLAELHKVKSDMKLQYAQLLESVDGYHARLGVAWEKTIEKLKASAQ